MRFTDEKNIDFITDYAILIIMLRVGIIGIRGYTGEELISILLKHPRVKINYLSARLDKPVPVSLIFPRFKNKIGLLCQNFDLARSLKSCDLFFLALPHTASMAVTPLLLKANKKVIDLSADYRIKNPGIYESAYKARHTDINNINQAIYGLPELNKAGIKKARFIANPGCYPTAAILAIAPLLRNKSYSLKDIVIDAKSGYSGAGRKPADDPFMLELKDDFKAYKVEAHQHAPEIEQELSGLLKKKIRVTFVPHLLPIERGILETIYVKTNRKPQTANHQLLDIYKQFYKDSPFVRIKKKGEFPRLKDVRFSNFCDIGINVREDKNMIIVISAIDNLVKGASGQAVQNMNLMCGFKETEGLL